MELVKLLRQYGQSVWLDGFERGWKSRRVYWLNPLASTPNYSPEVRGLKAVMPHIDALLPAHNLESLKEVIGAIR